MLGSLGLGKSSHADHLLVPAPSAPSGVATANGLGKLRSTALELMSASL